MFMYLAIELINDAASYYFFMPIAGQQDIIWQMLIFKFVVAVLLIAYLKISVRVKMTFTH